MADIKASNFSNSIIRRYDSISDFSIFSSPTQKIRVEVTEQASELENVL